MTIAEVENMISEVDNLRMKFGRPEKQKFYLNIRELNIISEMLQETKHILENKLELLKYENQIREYREALKKIRSSAYDQADKIQNQQ